MKTLIETIDSCTQTLKTQHAFLQKLRGEMQEGWKSEAGRIYSERMEEDLAVLNEAVQMFTSATNRLQAAESTYAQAETEMTQGLNRIYGKMSG